jgi:hypothetical protein
LELNGFRGNHVCCAVQESPVRFDAGNGAPGFVGPAASEAYTPEQQQACSDDAFRLCSSDIPDVDRVTACMIRKQDQLTPGCRVYFKPSEPEPAVRAGMPLSLSPAAERKRKP